MKFKDIVNFKEFNNNFLNTIQINNINTKLHF